MCVCVCWRAWTSSFRSTIVVVYPDLDAESLCVCVYSISSCGEPWPHHEDFPHMPRRLVGGSVCILSDYVDNLCFYVNGQWHFVMPLQKHKRKRGFVRSLTSHVDITAWGQPFGFNCVSCPVYILILDLYTWEFYFGLKVWWSEYTTVFFFYFWSTLFKVLKRWSFKSEKTRNGKMENGKCSFDWIVYIRSAQTLDSAEQ